jgi:phosphopantothenoylcysteine decarboxylase/phosphopantothenate--cysteine ligase
MLEATPDLLAQLGRQRRPGQVLVGFAAETDDLLANARGKLERKQVDMIVANDVAAPGVGFSHPTNAVTIVTAASEREVPLASKADIATAVVDEIARLRSTVRQAEARRVDPIQSDTAP